MGCQSQQSMPKRLFLAGGLTERTMGQAPRNRPKLLHLKLSELRDYLNLNQIEMAEKLQSEIASHSEREIPIKRSQISNFELERGEPDLFMMIGYARLGSVRIESLVDDDISVKVFRKLLGNEFNYQTTAVQRTKKRKRAKA